MKRIRGTCRLAFAALVLMAVGTVGTTWVLAATPDEVQQAESPSEVVVSTVRDPKSQQAIFYAVAFTMGVSCLSAGYAVGKVGAAALGAAAEKPELLGKAIIFVGLAEGIAIYGLIIGVYLISKL